MGVREICFWGFLVKLFAYVLRIRPGHSLHNNGGLSIRSPISGAHRTRVHSFLCGGLMESAYAELWFYPLQRSLLLSVVCGAFNPLLWS